MTTKWTSGGAPDGRYPPIGEYALLADCHSAALVSRAGSIDWACLRRFDAGSVFGRLLDWDRGGHFAIAPVGPATATRRYLGDSLVLETTLRTVEGTLRLVDGFTMRAGGGEDPPHELVRVAECVDGQVDVAVDIAPRFDYGGVRPWIRAAAANGTWLVVGGDDGLVLRSDARLAVDQPGSRLRGRVTLEAGARVRFALRSCAAHEVAGAPGAAVEGADDRLMATLAWWRDWSAATRAGVPTRRTSAARRRC